MEEVWILNTKKVFRVIIIVLFVILLVFLSYKFFTEFQSVDLSYSESKINKSEIYNSPQECYLKVLKSNDSVVKDKEKNRYSKSVYVNDTKTKYVEVFQTKNNYDVWIFVLDKKVSNGATKYCINDYANNVQLAKYDWENIDDYSYRVFDNKTELNKYNLNVSDTIEIKIETVNGNETLYFAIKDNK